MDEKRKDLIMRFRVDEDEKKLIAENAKADGRKMSDYIRRRALKKK